MPRTLCLLMLLAFISSCKRSEQPSKPVSGTTFTIKNDKGVALNYEFYRGSPDYENRTNCLACGRIESGATTDIQVDPGAAYVMVDIYSDDYSITNWSIMDSLLYHMPGPISTIEPSDIGFVGNNRKYFINTNNSETVWNAVNCINALSQAYIWDSLPAADRYRHLTLSKGAGFAFHKSDGAFLSAGKLRTDSAGLVTLKGITGEFTWSLATHYNGPNLQLNFSADTALLFQDSLIFVMVKE